MQKDYEKHSKPFNSTLDAHWNEFGHAFIARQLLRQIYEK
jgi:hypothetical protein